MKEAARYFLLVTLFFSTSAVAIDQCKIDQLKLTRVKTVLPAGSLDEVGRAAIKEAIVTVALYPVGMSLKTYKAASKLNYVKGAIGEKVLAQAARIPLIDDALSDLADVIAQNDNYPDDLIVRINGIRVIPSDGSETYLSMAKNATLDENTQGVDQLAKARASIMGSGSVQLIEYDYGSVNDDLGSFEVRDELLLQGNNDPVRFVNNEDRVSVYATKGEDGSIYEVGFRILPGEGDLNNIEERLFCDTDTCINAREAFPNDYRGITGISQSDEYEEIIECPSSYTDAGLFAADGEFWRVCEFKTPDCGFEFRTLDEMGGVGALQDGDIIVLRGRVEHKTTINVFGVPFSIYLGDSEGEGQYLANCTGCAPGAPVNLLFGARPHVMDPDRIAAQWRVKKLDNGKVALRSIYGGYLARCNGCIPGTFTFDSAFTHVNDPDNPAAQFILAPSPSREPNRYSVMSDVNTYLAPCKGDGCLPNNGRFGQAYSASFHLTSANSPLTEWDIAVRQNTRINLAEFAPEIVLNAEIDPELGVIPAGTIARSMEVPNYATWMIPAGEVLTITRGTTITLEEGAQIENNGTIINDGVILVGEYSKVTNNSFFINRESVRLRDGVFDNNAVFNHSQGYELSNQGSFNNIGILFAPFGRLSGANVTANQPVNGYLLDASEAGGFACSAIAEGVSIWNAETSTCSIENAWIKSGTELYITAGTRLEVTGSLSINGSVTNQGSIDNSNGLLRLCSGPGGLSGGGFVSEPLNVEQPCIAPDAQVVCESFFGPDTFNVGANVCNAGGGPDFPVGEGEEAVISAGITWSVSGWLVNQGSIVVEEGARLIVSGLVENQQTAQITNNGELSIEVDGESGIPGTIENEGFIDNFGTLNRDGNIVGFGFLEIKCGSIFNQISNFSPPYNPEGTFHQVSFDCPDQDPDWDQDGVENEFDAFPYDNGETLDTDGDGIGDNEDEFPLNPDEAFDNDGDCGVIDIQTVTSGNGCGDRLDAFNDDPTEQVDTDGDGVGDNSDAFPLNANESSDSDGDCGVIAEQTPTSGDGCGNNSDGVPEDPADTLDSDFDGQGDSSDSNPYDPENKRSISVDNSNGWSINTALFIPIKSLAIPAPEALSFPQGLLQIALKDGVVGSVAEITITFPEPLRDDMKWWKFGRTADNNQPHWYAFDQAVIAGNTITLSITDGGLGDDDGIANGEIIDPGGLVLPEAMFVDGFELIVPDQ